MDEANDMVIRSFNYIRSLTLMRSKSSLRDLFEKYLFSSLAKLAIYRMYPHGMDRHVYLL